MTPTAPDGSLAAMNARKPPDRSGRQSRRGATRTPGPRGYSGREVVPGVVAPELAPRTVRRETLAGLLVRTPSPPPGPPSVPAQPRRVLREGPAHGLLDRQPVAAEGKAPGTPRHPPA